MNRADEKFIIPEWLNHTCIACGECCRRGLAIWCPAAERDRLQKIGWASLNPNLADKPLFIPQGRAFRLALDENGVCRFLESDGHCLMHRHRGFDAKLLTCRMYPYSLVRTGMEIRVGLHFSCPAVRKNAGPPVNIQKSLLRELLADQERWLSLTSPAAAASLAPGVEIAWSQAELIEHKLDDLLADMDLEITTRIAAADDFLADLAEESPAVWKSEAAEQLVDYHATQAREKAVNSPPAPGKLSFWENLLRRACLGGVAALAERRLGTSGAGQWSARIRRLRLATSGLFGRLRLPDQSHGPTEAAVRQIRARPLPSGGEELLSRYLRTRLAGRMYYGTECWGLPLLAGARLNLALAGQAVWLGRTLAAMAGREDLAYENLSTAVGLVDHAYGHLGGLPAGPFTGALTMVLRPGCAKRMLNWSLS